MARRSVGAIVVPLRRRPPSGIFRRVRTLGVLLALALSLPRVALAQDAIALTWTAPATCPTRADVVASAIRLRPALASARSDLRAVAVVTPAPRSRWRVRVRTEAGAEVGERVLEARTCAQLGEATAVVLALAFDALPDAPPPRERPALPDSVEQIDDPEAAPFRQPVAPPPPAPRVRTRYDLGLHSTVDPLTFSALALHVGLHGALSRGVLRAELGLAWQLPTTAEGTRAGTGTEVMAATITARGCVMRAREVVSLGLCATFVGGAMWATAFGLQRNDTALRPWASAGGGGVLRVAVARGRVAALLHVDAVAHLTRPRFVVEGTTRDAGAIPALGLLAGLGVEVRLP